MIRKFHAIIMLAGVLFFTCPALAAVQIVIIDNGGTLQSKDSGSVIAKKALLNKLATEKSGFFGEDDIVIVLTNTGNVEYRQKASLVPSTIRPVLPYLEARPTCNNLVEAFNAARSILKDLSTSDLKGSEVHLFSSLIHTPRPCEGYTASVPQPVPADLDVSFFAKKGVPVSVYWAERSQKKVWERFFAEKDVKATVRSVVETVSLLQVEAD